MRVTIHGVPKDTAERFLLDPQGGVWHLCRAADLPGTWQVSPGAACETPCEAFGLTPMPVAAPVVEVAPVVAAPPEAVAVSTIAVEPQAKEDAGRGAPVDPPPEFMAGFLEEKAEEPAPVKPTKHKHK